MDSALEQTFLNTRYVVAYPKGDIVLRVGEHCPALDLLLAGCDPPDAAFITAWNPGAVRMAPEENARRQAALLAAVRRLGHAFLPGRGEGAGGAWPPEASILVLGIGRRQALELARAFGQAALVYAARGQPVALLACD
ncbi:MAG: DUF3293 domain-containing protein [Terriglobales bacterium]